MKGIRAETEILMQPVLSREIIEEGVPGNIRKAEHFLPMLRKLVLYLKELMKERSTQIKSPLSLVCELQEKHFVEQRTLKFMHQRLQILLNTLQVDRVEDFSALSLVTNLASLLATYYKGFSVIVEPYPSSQAVFDPHLQFYCLDAALATKPVFKKFRNVVLTSGTISPLEIYPKILQFEPKVSRAFNISLPRNAI